MKLEIKIEKKKINVGTTRYVFKKHYWTIFQFGGDFILINNGMEREYKSIDDCEQIIKGEILSLIFKED